MRDEIDTVLLAWLDEQRCKHGNHTLTELLDKLGIPMVNAKETLYAWGWRRHAVPRHILTVWSEDITIDQNGVWETGAPLVPSGDSKFNSDQLERESDRIGMLDEIWRGGEECKVILLINERSREDVAKGMAASAEFRVIDTELWHIELCDISGVLKLRRGPRRVNKPNTIATAEPNTDEQSDAGFRMRFPDQETRDRVERAAIEHAIRIYSSAGSVKSVESENLGYDLAVNDNSSGELKFKVEVKGTSGEEQAFYLTRNEYREGARDRHRWRLAIVVNALSVPELQEYRFDEMVKVFDLDPLVWHCSIKRPA